MESGNLLTIASIFIGFIGAQALHYYRKFEAERQEMFAKAVNKMEEDITTKIEKLRTKFDADIQKVKLDIYDLIKDKMGKSVTEKGTYSTFGVIAEDDLDGMLNTFVEENETSKQEKKNLLLNLIKNVGERKMSMNEQNHHC